MEKGFPVAFGIRRSYAIPVSVGVNARHNVYGLWRFFRSGNGRIAGVVQINGVVTSRQHKLRLYDRQTGALIASTLSNTDGTYLFEHLDNRPAREYTVISIDDTRHFNAVVQDMVRPT